jgi:hypothetical protein
MSFAGRWKATRGDLTMNYTFVEDGTFHLQVRSPYFTQNKNGKWDEEDGKLSARFIDTGTPGTSGFSRGREIDVKIQEDGSLSIDGSAGSRQSPAKPMRAARLSRIAEKLAHDPHLQPKGGITHCAEFVRKHAAEGWPGQQHPELEGRAGGICKNLAKASEHPEATGWRRLEGDRGQAVIGDRKRLVDAQDQANKATGPVIACRKNPNPTETDSGHVCMITPLRLDDKMPMKPWAPDQPNLPVPMCAQAGADNFAYKPLTEAFGPKHRDGVDLYSYAEPKR